MLGQKTSSRKLFTNSVYNTASWFVIVLVGIVFTPYIVRKLTVEGYGVYALLTGLIGYYGLLDLGLGEGITKFVSECKAKGDVTGVVKSINAALQVQMFFGVIGSTVLIIFAEWILGWLKVSPGFSSPAKIGLYLIAVGFLFTMLSGTYVSALKGLQSYDMVSKINMGMNIALNVLIVAYLAFGGGLVEVVALSVLYAAVSFYLSFRILVKLFPAYRFSFDFDRQYFTRLFHFSGFLFLSRISTVFNTYIVRFVIAFYLGPAMVTFYFIPSRVSQIFGGLLSSVFNVVFPFASELGANNEIDKLRKIFTHGSRWFAAIAVPLFLMTAVFSKTILHLWMGQEFAEKGWVVLMVLSFGAIIGSISTVPNLVTMGLGYSKVISVFSLFTVLCYVILVPLLTKFFGIVGAAWAIFFAQIPGLFLIIYEARVIMGLNVFEYFRESLGFHLVPCIGAIVFVSLTAKNPMLYGNAWIFGCVAVMVIYFGAMALSGWLPVGEVLRRVKGKT